MHDARPLEAVGVATSAVLGCLVDSGMVGRRRSEKRHWSNVYEA